MALKRTYTIKVTTLSNGWFYVKDLKKILGYRFSAAGKIKTSQKWKNKKSLDKIVKSLNEGLFEPGFDTSLKKTYKYEVIETTPKKILRLLKLKKIMK